MGKSEVLGVAEASDMKEYKADQLGEIGRGNAKATEGHCKWSVMM